MLLKLAQPLPMSLFLCEISVRFSGSSLPVNVINWQPAISDITAEESLNPEVLHFKLAVFKFYMYFLARNSHNNCQIFLLFGNWMKQSVTDLNHTKHKIDTLGLSSSPSLQFKICKECPGLNAVTDIKWNQYYDNTICNYPYLSKVANFL